MNPAPTVGRIVLVRHWFNGRYVVSPGIVTSTRDGLGIDVVVFLATTQLEGVFSTFKPTMAIGDLPQLMRPDARQDGWFWPPREGSR